MFDKSQEEFSVHARAVQGRAEEALLGYITRKEGKGRRRQDELLTDFLGLEGITGSSLEGEGSEWSKYVQAGNLFVVKHFLGASRAI